MSKINQRPKKNLTNFNSSPVIIFQFPLNYFPVQKTKLTQRQPISWIGYFVQDISVSILWNFDLFDFVNFIHSRKDQSNRIIKQSSSKEGKINSTGQPKPHEKKEKHITSHPKTKEHFPLPQQPKRQQHRQNIRIQHIRKKIPIICQLHASSNQATMMISSLDISFTQLTVRNPDNIIREMSSFLARSMDRVSFQKTPDSNYIHKNQQDEECNTGHWKKNTLNKELVRIRSNLYHYHEQFRPVTKVYYFHSSSRLLLNYLNIQLFIFQEN